MKTIQRAIIGLVMAGPLLAQDTAIARGKYLVEEVSKCQDCHTPKTATGEPDKSKWLKGAVLSFKPMSEVPKWHPGAPDLTSTSALWQRWGMDGMVKFLETGKNPRGNAADPPMPAYTLTHDDAVAIATYLKSLP
jgi:mono/diheme cytochrome c family protein